MRSEALEPWEPTAPELDAMRVQAAAFRYRPVVSIAIPLARVDELWIKATLNSALGQCYPGIEVCVAADNADYVMQEQAVAMVADGDSRVKIAARPNGSGARSAREAAVAMASGEFVTFVDAADELAPDAIFRVVELLQRIDADVVYGDEDSIDEVGLRSAPRRKPLWSPDLLLSHNFIGRPCIMRTALLHETRGDHSPAEGVGDAWEYDLLLRLSERTRRFVHLPGSALYHRRTLPGPRPVDQRADAVGLAAVRDSLRRRAAVTKVESDGDAPAQVSWQPRGRVSVTAIVIDSDGGKPPALEGMKSTEQLNVHQTLFAGRARDGNMRGWERWPSRAANEAAQQATGEYLLFLKGDASRRASDGHRWLLEMIAHAQREEIGAVGCRLIAPTGELRQGGVRLDLGGLETGERENADSFPHFGRLTLNPAVVSAHCMVLRRSLFEGAGGFDDQHLKGDFFDLDLCFRLGEMGFLHVCTPHVTIACSPRRGQVSAGDIAYMWERWWGELAAALAYRRDPTLALPPGSADEFTAFNPGAPR